MNRNFILIAATTLALSTPAAAFADIYTLANFSGSIAPGSTSVKAPFLSAGISPGMTIGGSFVFDNSLIPAAGTGLVNVVDTSFPDFATIAPATLFKLTVGDLTFTAADVDQSPGLAVQYNNGHFNGFFYRGGFAYQGGSYEVQVTGGNLRILALNASGVPQLGNAFVTGFVNIGDAAVTNPTTFTPPRIGPAPGVAVPEPATWAVMVTGFGGVGLVLRRRRPRGGAFSWMRRSCARATERLR